MSVDHWTDQECTEFLRALDDAAPGLEVTDWEARFIEDNLDTWHYTPGRRKVLADLHRKYGKELD